MNSDGHSNERRVTTPSRRRLFRGLAGGLAVSLLGTYAIQKNPGIGAVHKCAFPWQNSCLCRDAAARAGAVDP